jgi:hypothetical protein
MAGWECQARGRARCERAGAFGGRAAGHGEIDEAFLAVQPDDVKRDAHAHGDDLAIGGYPCAAVAFEAPAAFGQVLALDHAADAHVRNLDHQAHRPDVGDEAVELVRIVHLRHALEVFEEFDHLRFAFRFGGGAFGVGNVAGNLAQVGLRRSAVRVFRRVLQQRLQRAVDDEVGVAADGAGEVAVVALARP